MDDDSVTRRRTSAHSYVSGTIVDGLLVEEGDLRWRRSSHAAISAMLPSHGAFNSDTGITVARTLNSHDRRKSMQQRRSNAALRGYSGNASSPDPSATVSSSSSMRQLRRRLSQAESMLLGEEDRMQTVASIRSMTACIAVKKKYRIKACGIAHSGIISKMMF